MRIVVKVGTSTLAYANGCLNIRAITQLCTILSDLKNAGHEIVLVSSGAIGMGAGKLAIKGKPKSIEEKQASAAVGQCMLMYTYDKLFSEYNHTVAQILLTGDDFAHENRHENFQKTIKKLLEFNVLPIINENDTIATDEIKVGDNDRLSALVATSIAADKLVILSDIDGLYTNDPRKDREAKLIPVIENITDEVMSFGKDSAGNLGTGGMKTKLLAAKICTEAGCDMIISNGKKPEVLYDIAGGKDTGTLFSGKKH